MTIHASSFVFHGPGLPLELRTTPLPLLRPGEVLVRVAMTTLCGSDLHTFHGRRTGPCPTILGHEIVGEVVELPPGEPILDRAGHPLSLGDRITWSLAVGCGSCYFCRHELPQKCVRLFKYGHAPITAEHTLHGGLTTHCHLLAGTPILRLPASLPESIACPASCATATVAAALRHAGIVEGCSVLIQGAGMLGLTAAAWLRTAGAELVVVADVNPARRETALQFGAHCTLSSTDPEMKANLLGLTAGRGVDIALEMCGAPEAVESGIDLLRVGGRYVLVGAVFPARPVSVSVETLVRKHLTLHGVHNYHPCDLQSALDFLTANQHRFPFADLVGPPVSLHDAEEAFRLSASGRYARVAVVP